MFHYWGFEHSELFCRRGRGVAPENFCKLGGHRTQEKLSERPSNKPPSNRGPNSGPAPGKLLPVYPPPPLYTPVKYQVAQW